jgi:hypothetical protein
MSSCLTLCWCAVNRFTDAAIGSYPLKISEHVLSLKEVPLSDDRGRVQPILGMATGFLTYRGEDVTASGRVRARKRLLCVRRRAPLI